MLGVGTKEQRKGKTRAIISFIFHFGGGGGGFLHQAKAATTVVTETLGIWSQDTKRQY